MTENLFGTDGIRGTIGQPPFSLEFLSRLGTAIALWAQQRYGTEPILVLGHDTRASCHFVKSTIQSSLMLHPITVYDADILPTPALYHLTTHTHDFDCGIIISASHNPYQDNGIKIIDQHGGKISAADEELISDLFYRHQHENTYSTFGKVLRLNDAAKTYSSSVSSFFPHNVIQGKKVVLDCANGATYKTAPHIFKQLGAETIVLHDKPNGVNINNQCGALHLQDLQQAVQYHQADIGFAFDGDGDRVIAVNKYGHIKNGDDILTLLLMHPAYQNTKTLVGTVMTNHGLSVYLSQLNKSLIRTNVGDKYVAESLIKENLIIGGEQSGHIILRDYLETGDGIFTALRVMEALLFTNNWDMITFKQYPQILINVPVAVKKDLARPELASLIAGSNAQLHSGRLVVRYSGTENLLRIMVEDNEFDHAQRIGTQLSQALQKELSMP